MVLSVLCLLRPVVHACRGCCDVSNYLVNEHDDDECSLSHAVKYGLNAFGKLFELSHLTEIPWC